MATNSTARLAYDDEGSGIPIVFLHGLTFDRRSWRPIIERLDGRRIRSIAVDLPAHGESGGDPAALQDVAAMVHDLASMLAVDRPVVVGHSMSGAVASLYVGAHSSRGLVTIDSGLDIRPMSRLVQGLEPALRGPGFAGAWQMFEDSLGLDLIPEPSRSLVRETRVVRQDVVLGYWAMLLHTDPDEFQVIVDANLRQIDVPYLAFFGRPITAGEQERLEWFGDVQLEGWTGDGHFLHLVEPDRFVARLMMFVEHCTVSVSARPQR